MEITDLKPGDKLYRFAYWSSRFRATARKEMETLTIKKVTKNKIFLKGGYTWTVTERMFMSEWFPSKAEAYQLCLDAHKVQLKEAQEIVELNTKEIKWLEKKIKEAKACQQ